MAFSPADTIYSIVAEATAGVVPATPAFLQLPYVGGTMPMLQTDTLESNQRLPQRGSAGIRSSNFRVAGGNKVHLKRDPAIELLLQSALSGTWTSNVLTAGKTETNLTIEELNVDGANTLIRRFSGVQVSEFSFSADFSGNIEADFTYTGLNMTTATGKVTGATYAAPNYASLNYTGLDLTAFTVAGVSGLTPTKFDLKVTNDREAQGQFGSASARGVGTSGKKVTGSVTFYRTDFNPETVMFANGTNPDVAVSFTLGSGTGNVLAFSMPAVNFAAPNNAEDGSKLLVTMDYTATIDPTTLTDIKITRS